MNGVTANPRTSSVPRARNGSNKKAASKRLNKSRAAPPPEHLLGLTPGFRDRLIHRLDQSGVPSNARMAYVAALTDRAAQTVSRWFDPQRPGLPDMESCARLCQGLPCSADWILGLPSPPAKNAPRRAVAQAGDFELSTRWMVEVIEQLCGAFGACEPMRMKGDEMTPKIRDGDMMFVDTTTNSLDGNGIYALECDGRVMVRKVESRIGKGLVFKCENPQYEERVVKDAAAARRLGLRVIGKVTGAIGAVRFWVR
jgi:Peptidase S24-like